MRRLVRIRTEDLSDDLKASIIRIGNEATNSNGYDQFFTLYFPSGGRHFLAYEDDAVVSHAIVTTRWLEIADQPPMKTAYVDGVATLPQYQGRGHSTAVMRLLAENIDDYVIGCLETERETFYERVGWETWPGPLAGRNEHDELTPTPDQHGVMILRLPQTPLLDRTKTLIVRYETGGRIW